MSLNPNAPLFVPAAFRQVEDFSPEWWELVTTSPWFHDYWLSQHQNEGGFNGGDDDDIADLLPETFDLDAGEDLSMEALFEEFIRFSELEGEKPTNDYGFGTEALIQNMRYLEAKSPKYLVDRPNYVEKPAKNASAKYSPRRIQQPR